jgi:hypothetical protein
LKRFFLLIAILLPSFVLSRDIVINEVMSSNQTTILDEDGNAPDWIELYNAGNEPIHLSGYGLSDDSLDVRKWRFDSSVVEAGGHLLIFASGKDRRTSPLHTNFKIRASGEKLWLSDPTGAILDRVELPTSRTDISYARQHDGSLPWMFQRPTPGSANTGLPPEEAAESISVAPAAGFYPSPVSVTLSAGGSPIFYTLDGSDPDSSDVKYSAPVLISKTTVLKAVGFNANHSPGPLVIHSYFINETTDLPVISLSSDPYNLFDYNYGIYADGPGWTAPEPHHGANYWMDWERPAHIEFFDDAKNPGFSENCGIAISGAYTRAYAQKAFSVKFKKEYGVSRLEYPLFPGFNVTTFQSFILRNSGNDFMYTHIRDAVAHALVKDLDIDYLEYRPATTFINGEYWGIFNIREKISEHYVAARHGVDPDNIDMLENNMAVIHGDSLHYRQLIDYISVNDMSTDAAYNHINSMIDLDECLLYFAAQAYYNSQDWPGVNIKYWRGRSARGKWRWILFDVDFGFNLYETNGQAEDHISFMFSPVETRYSNAPWATLLQRKLVANPRIKNRFVNQIADLLNTNFKSARVVSVIHALADHIANELPRHRRRFGITGENLNRMLSFAQERPGYLRDFTRNYFHCGNDGSLTIQSAGGGTVKLNTLSLKSTDMPWTGVYFQGNEVHLDAIPDPGYKFDGWSGAVTSQGASLSLSTGRSTTLTAAFSIDGSQAERIVINEINYHSSDSFNPGDWIELYNRSSQNVDLGNWVLADSGAGREFTFPAGTLLPPDGYLILTQDRNAFSTLFPDVSNSIGDMDFGLSGSGEWIRLSDAEGRLVDSLAYADQAPWPAEADGLGATLELVDPAGDNALPENWRASMGHGSPGVINTVTASIDDNPKTSIPTLFSLSQNYPNPFNPSTTIRFTLASSSFVSLKIIDLRGREISNLVSEEMKAGTFSRQWNASHLSSGIYLCCLNAGAFKETKKLFLLK